MAVYTLPDLPYDYGALEPVISGEIMELHHDKHHAAYVKGANDTLDAGELGGRRPPVRASPDEASLVGRLMDEPAAAFLRAAETAQAGAGIVAARHRGDLASADALLEGIEDRRRPPGSCSSPTWP